MNTENRIKLERKIVRKAVKDLLAKYSTISVNDGEIWVLKRSTDLTEVMKALFSTDEDSIAVYDASGNRQGSVYFVYGNDGYDVIADYSIGLEDALKGANELAAKYE